MFYSLFWVIPWHLNFVCSECCILSFGWFPGKSWKPLLHTLNERRQPPDSLISTIPFLALTQGRFSLTYLHWPPTWGCCLPQPVSLLRHAPSPSPLLAIGSSYFWATPFPIWIPNNLFWLFFLLAPPMKMEQSVLKRWHIKFRCQGITQCNMNYEVYERKVDTRDKLLTCIFGYCCLCKETRRSSQRNDLWSLHMNCKVHWGWCLDFQTFTVNCNKAVI